MISSLKRVLRVLVTNIAVGPSAPPIIPMLASLAMLLLKNTGGKCEPRRSMDNNARIIKKNFKISASKRITVIRGSHTALAKLLGADML